MADLGFQPKDVVVFESPPGYDAEPVPGIILEVTDETAGESDAHVSEDELKTLSDHYGESVSESDPIYRIRDLYLTDDGAVPGESTYLIPEGAITYRKQQ